MMPPEVPGDPAREGTCAAWVAEMVLTGAVSTANDMIGQSHENGWLVEPDMANHIQGYVDLVKSYGGVIHTERKVRLNKHIAGTPDAYAILDDIGTLIVDDLKYGYGIVEPYQNEQISIYAMAILRYLAARDVIVRNVVIGVYQPRPWHPLGIHRTWGVFPEQLGAYVNTIEAAAEKAQNPDAGTTPGEHCRYCPAAATCQAVGEENYRIHERLHADVQRHMTADEVAKELKFLDVAEAMLKGRKDALHAEAKARIAKAEHIPGWHMEQGAGQRRFTASRDVIHVMTGIDPTADKMVTPMELERRGADPEVVKRMTETPRTAPKLKPVPPGYYNALFNKRGK